MKKSINYLARAAMMLLFAVLGSIGAWAQTTTFTYTAEEQVAKFDTYENFTGATALKSHTFADGTGTVVYEGMVTGLGTRALNGTKLTGITLPAGITSLGERAFTDCSKLATITFADDGAALTSIGDYAFAGCDPLTSFVIPNSVTTFGNYVFQSCDELATVTIGTGITVLGERTFLNCKKLETVIFAGTPTLTTIGKGAFYSCEALTAIEIPASVEIIGSGAFNGCIELATITFAEGSKLTTIEGSAFYNCKKLTSIDLPETLTTLGHKEINYMEEEVEQGSVFSGCGLTSLHLPTSLEHIYGGGHVANCPLTSLTMDDTGGWQDYFSPKGSNAIVSMSNSTLVIGCAATKNLDNLQFVGAEAFWGESQPFSLTLPSNVVRIYKRAFHLAQGLTAINIPNNVSTIEEDCFSGTSLTTITLHDGVTEIKKQAFMGCPSLKTVYLGRYLTEIGQWAFEMCTAVTDVYCTANPEELTWDGKGFAETTVFHVADAAAWQAKFPDATVKFETYAPEEEFVTVCKPNGSSYYPIGVTSKYILSQQVYTAKEIAHAAGTITSLGFNTYNGGVSRNYKIYVTKTDNNYADSYVPVTDADLVFSGDVFYKSGQWNAIDFDTPIQYDGTSNLLVTICDNTGAKGDYSTLTNGITRISSQCIEVDSEDQTFDATAGNEEFGFSHLNYKPQIQLCFETNPKPSKLTVADVTNESALVSCTLRGGKKWNCRYRKVAAEGEEEQRWVEFSNLTDRSITLAELTPSTQYEVQVQAVYDEDTKSVWTASKTFFTACCPEEDMCDIIYSMNVGNPNTAAFQIVDAETGIEMAYVQFSTSGVSGGALSLCKGRKYNVNFILNKAAYYETQSCNFTLFYAPGDEFYTMNYNEAPERDALLTTFIMDCGDYCTTRPRFVTTSDIDYQSVTLSYDAVTVQEEIQYSTDPTFPDNENTKTVIVTRDEVEKHTTYLLQGLESLTLYYLRLRSNCVDENGKIIGDKFSRWTDPKVVVTRSKYTIPLRVRAKARNSSTEDLSWSRLGKEKLTNVNYRQRGASTPATNLIILDLDGDGQSFETGTGWGDGIYASEAWKKNVDNVIAVYNVPANSAVAWKAGQGITGKNGINQIYGFLKQQKEYGDSDEEKAEAQAALKGALQSQKQKEEEAQADPEFLQNKLAEARELEEELRAAEALYGANPTPANLIGIQRLQMKLNALENGIAPEQLTAEEEAAQATLAGATEEQQPNEARMVRRAPTRTGEEEVYYTFFIRHHVDPSDVLLVTNITITPAENIGEWITIPNVKDVDYALSGLKAGTEYDVMVQPVYDSGFVGIDGPITIFKTLGEESEPLDGVFSVSTDKKVSFAKGNLQYSMDSNQDDHWKLAEHQYDIFGLDNLKTQEPNEYGNRFPSENHLDLFCWSTRNSNKGTIHTYPVDDDSYYKGAFVEWGTLPEFTSIYGQGWLTLSKDEWTYLLSERENAATLKAFATISYQKGEGEEKVSVSVKGLILLPDDWTGGELAASYTAETWATLETAGAVFLPAAGTLTARSEDSHFIASVNGLDDGIGSYWSSTPSETDINAFAMTFNATETKVEPAEDIYRRIGSAVRLVKVAEDKLLGDANGDGIVNAVDIVEMVNAKNGNASANFRLKNVDFDGDGSISDAEINAVADIILGKAQ